MKKLRSLQWIEPSARQRKRLADWLRAWELDRRLSSVQFGFEAKRPAAQGPVGEIASKIAAFDDAPLNRGEIRLISGLLLPVCPRPLYAAVLAEWEQGLWLIAPFGRFSEPATPGELLTNREAAALRVLCLWNTHSVPADVLQRSWLVEQMSSEELADSWCVFQHALTGKELPASLQDRVGPAIFRNEDPRIEYQEQETGFLEPFKARAIEWAVRSQAAETSKATEGENQRTGQPRPGGSRRLPSRRDRSGRRVNIMVLPGLTQRPQEEEFALAAAGEKCAEKPRIIWIVSPPLQLRFTVEGENKAVSIWVLDKKGDPSSQLNGAKFLSKDGAELGTVLDAQCLLDFDQVARGFQLITKEGKILNQKNKAKK